MNTIDLLIPILFPLFAGLLVLFVPCKKRFTKEVITVLAALVNFIYACVLFNKEAVVSIPWLGKGLELSLRLYQFNGFIIAAAGFFSLLVAIYAASFMNARPGARQFYFYLLLTVSLVNGALLSDNLVGMLFFWEGLLLTLFGMIYLGNPGAARTATKAFTISAVTDLCMMAGIALTGYISGTLNISQVSMPSGPLASAAFILLCIGAVSKAGSMPFHTWIPDAANDAPLPFMAFLPASLEKLLGIYFLTRITWDMFKLSAGSALSITLMAVGALTIVLAVLMALIQKDFKRLLSYHAISQVGYMILGIGTALPIGIVGGLFHMLNNAIYKSCLFFTGGAVEKQAGTTDLSKLGGLARNMPLTFGCFLVAAVSISGVPPFNGFFSKELIYDAALESGRIFYVAAIAGSFLTALSFLKLGHAAFLGKRAIENEGVKESGALMLWPMIALAVLCIAFGLFNALPVKNFIQPVLGPAAAGEHFAGIPSNLMLVFMTIVVLIAALLSHLWQAKSKGSALKAADYIHYAPGLRLTYSLAEKKWFDPYEIGLKILRVFSYGLYFADRVVDWTYSSFLAGSSGILARGIRRAHNGNFATYLGWALLGSFLVTMYIMLKG